MLSIIIPVYNVEKFINKCVDSIINQDYKDFEILLIDDGSKDKSAKICDDYASKYDNVRVFHKENGGAASAYILGIKESKGDYVTFVDSDDWIEPDMYSSMMPYFEDSTVNMVFCSYDKVFVDKHIQVNFGISEGYYSQKDIDKFFNKPNSCFVSVSRCNKIFLKQDLLNLLPYLNDNMRYAEDNLFCLAYMMKFFKKAYYVDKVLYHYYYNDKSVSTCINREKITQLNAVHNKLLKIDEEGQYAKLINSMYIEFVFRMFRTIMPSNVSYAEKIKLMKFILNSDNFKIAKDNCIWNCYSFKQKVKKFLIKRKMCRIYYYLDKMTKGK